ncbi:PREDICTED: nudC domain-containing protein 1 [Nicrophorus vespilloides]|uniref:NudC domain-containing protein 1 n=1 Tax=Nicrophorus vespilloides TaxID=110193 RepID=A0ABM1MAQ1_NICVS|nr:PREDICTED: nudC domain-containing protein 1 [Nicrophorus vespilloides]
MPDDINLRANRELIDSDFAGYKLSLASLSTYSEKNIETPLTVPTLNCGYKETKLFSLHNHLFANNSDNDVYYIDASFVIQQIGFDLLNGIFNKSSVWELPIDHKPTYNPTLDFPSDKLAVVSDGISSIYILEIDRENSDWKLMRKIDVDCAVVIKHSKLLGDKLHCLLYNIVENKSNLLWIEVDLLSDQFDVHKFESQGDLYFAQVIESDSILVGAEKTFFPETNEAEIKYVWSQDSDTIRVEFKVGSKAIVKDGNIQVFDKDDNVLMVGRLGGELKENSVVFNEENGTLALTASKQVSGVKWIEFIEGLSGDYKADELEVIEANTKLSKFTTENEIYSSSSICNNADMEECDFPENNNAVIERLKKTGATHRSNLGGSKYLFNAKDSIVLQQDEDANLWENVCESEEWRLKHVASLTAMGYIQASKQRKKIMTCSPNHDYVVISESHCHVFVYRQNHSFGGELRNRKCGKTLHQLAQQFVLNLGQDEILGVVATDHVLYMLTEKKLFACILN